MNSDKAADVRDSLNALPCVATDPDVSENYPARDILVKTRAGEEWKHTGECVDLKKQNGLRFQPARIHQAGQIGFGDDPTMRPCYEVILEPVFHPMRPLPSISIPPSVVHEIAKHSCRIRVTSGLRGEWKPGVVRVRDDLAHEDQPDDRDTCESCGCSRFQLKDGVPECERCGETHESAVEVQEQHLTIGDFTG